MKILQVTTLLIAGAQAEETLLGGIIENAIDVSAINAQPAVD